MEAPVVSISCVPNTIHRLVPTAVMAAGEDISSLKAIKTYGLFCICGILKMYWQKMVKVEAAIIVRAEPEKILL